MLVLPPLLDVNIPRSTLIPGSIQERLALQLEISEMLNDDGELIEVDGMDMVVVAFPAIIRCRVTLDPPRLLVSRALMVVEG